jgi:hypothetical protein
VPLGASWGDDDNIIAALNKPSGLSRIPSGSGAPTPVTKLNREEGERQAWPQVLLAAMRCYSPAMWWEDANIEILSLQDQPAKEGCAVVSLAVICRVGT